MTLLVIFLISGGYPDVQVTRSDAACMSAGLQAWRRSELYGNFYCVPQ